MGKETQQERQWRSAREELARGLARRDAELAVAALLKLEASAREPSLAAVGALARAEIEAERARGNWSRLVFWAVRCEREPRLLGEPAAASAARWALLWGCVRSREWARAKALFAPLEPQLAPELAGRIGAVLAGEPLAAPSGAGPVADARLGYDRGQRSRAAAPEVPPAPTTPEQCEPAVVACAAVLGLAAFGDTVLRWADGAPGLAEPILTVAARLTAGVLFATPDGESAEAARVVAQLAKRLGHPAALQTEATLALRAAAAFAAGTGEAGLSREQMRRFAAVVRPLAGFPALREPCLALASATAVAPEAAPVALELFSALLADHGATALAPRALLTWAAQDTSEASAPGWIGEALSELLAREAALPRALDALPRSAAIRFLDLTADVLAIPVAAAVLDAAWSWADAHTLREAALRAFDGLLARARLGRAHAAESVELMNLVGMLLSVQALEEGAPAAGPEEIKRFMATPAGRKMIRSIQTEMGTAWAGPLQGAARELWGRFADRVVPCGSKYLEIALEQTRGVAQRRACVAQYFAHAQSGLSAEVEALVGAWREEEDRAAKAIVEWMTWKRRGDLEQLAQAVVAVAECGLPRSVMGKFASAFEDAQAKAPPAVASEAIARACKVSEYLRHSDGRRRRRGTGKKRSDAA